MRYAVRISLPDEPGALAGVAAKLGTAGIDVISLRVIERADAIAVDDIVIEGPATAAVVWATLEQVRGVAVEAVAPVPPGAAEMTATALAAQLAEQPDDSWQGLVDGLPGAIGASWALAVGQSANGTVALAASLGAPQVPLGLRLPFLPVGRPCRWSSASWMPPAWSPGEGGPRADFAATRLTCAAEAVVVGRPHGPRFRSGELDRLSEIARVAVAASARIAVPV